MRRLARRLSVVDPRMLLITLLSLTLAIPVTQDSARSSAGKEPPPRTFKDIEAAVYAAEGLPAPITPANASGSEANSRHDLLSVLSFNLQHRCVPHELAAIAQRLRLDAAETPDVMLLQEVVFEEDRAEDDDSAAATLAHELQYHCRGTKRASDKEGVAIISRYPFEHFAVCHHEAQTNRLLLGFSRVSVMGEFCVPDVGLVRVVNVHFTNWGFEAHIRRQQLRETLHWIAQRQKEAPADIIILGGDFNIEPDGEELKLLTDADATGNLAYANHNRPYTATFGTPGNADKRVDYIYIAQPGGESLTHHSEQTLWRRGLQPPGTNDRLLVSDHLPLLHEFVIHAPNVDDAANATAPTPLQD